MDKLKELWASLVAKVGLDWAIAVVILAVLFFIEPALAIIGGVLFTLYKSGKLDKLIAKFRKE